MLRIACGPDKLRAVGIMSKKTSEARKRAFFAALAETGNQTISAERARVSRSWVILHRRTDPAFRARMEAVLAEARARLADAAEQRPAHEKWRGFKGETLVLRGGNRRQVQIMRARLKEWTPRIEARFLRTLAASCNVKAACAAVGMSRESAYARRARWHSFARRWEQALDIGYTRLEFALVENAGNMLEGVKVDPEAPIPPMTVAQAIQLLGLHRRKVKLGYHGVHRASKPTDVEALKAEIVRKAKVLDRAEKMKAERLLQKLLA